MINLTRNKMEKWILAGFMILLVFLIFACNLVSFPLEGGTTLFGEQAIRSLQFKRKENKYRLAAVMVEPRTKNLIETINLFLKNLPLDTHFVIYHGSKNKNLLLQTYSDEIQKEKLSLHNLGVENLTINSYSKLLTSIEFYESIPSENILIFQTDAVVCGNTPFKIEQFMNYDFIGAPLSGLINNSIHFYFLARAKLINYKNYMNGGLSFRKKSKMIQVLTKYPWDHMIAEDIWIVSNLYKMNANLPTKAEARKFFYEAEKLIDIPWGVHKPRKNIEVLKIICPEINQIETVPSNSDYKSLYML